MTNKHKNKTKVRILVPPEDIPKELYDRLKKYCAVKINSDNIKLLTHYPPFIKRVTLLRKKFPVPKLSFQKDRIKTKNPPLTRIKPKNLSASSCDFRPDPQSKWFNSLPTREQIKLEKEIDLLLKAFNLPITFDWRAWLTFYLLYNDENLYRPLYNFEPLIPSPRAPLTTDEKRVLRQVIKFRKRGDFSLDNETNLLSAIQREYARALKTKNKLKSLKNIGVALKDIKLRKKKGEIYKDDSADDSYRISPLDLIGRIWEEVEDISEKADRKRYQCLRKIRERFKKTQMERFHRKRKT